MRPTIAPEVITPRSPLVFFLKRKSLSSWT